MFKPVTLRFLGQFMETSTQNNAFRLCTVLDIYVGQEWQNGFI